MQIDWNEVVYYKNGTLYRRSTDRPLLNRGSSGHLQFSHKDKWYLVSRVIWELFNGSIPEGMLVAYKDRSLPLDPRIENLRLQTRAQISAKRRTKLGGLKGVSSTKYGRYFVRVGAGGTHRYVGIYDTPQQAADVASSIRSQLYGD